MRQIWVIDWSAPQEIKSILDEMMVEAQKGRGIHRIPFCLEYVSENEEDAVVDYINSQQPAVVADKVYYNYDW